MQKMIVVAATLLVACSREIPLQKQSVVTPRPIAPPPAAVSYYEGNHAAEAIQQIRAKVGEPFRVLSIRIDSDYVAVEAQDPKKKENVDRYKVDRGVLKPSQPVRLIGDTDEKTLEANLFDPTTVDWAKIPDILREGNEKIQLEGRELSGISIARNMFKESRPVMVDVNYRGTRKFGFLRVDRHGLHPEVSIH